MSNSNKERRKMRFEQVERMLNSDIGVAEWCKLNKVAKSTMYHWLKIYRESKACNSKRKGWIEIDRQEIKDAKALTVTNVSTPTSNDVVLDTFAPATSQVCAHPIKLRANGVEIDVCANTKQADIRSVLEVVVSL